MNRIIKKSYKPDYINYQKDSHERDTIIFSTSHKIGEEREKTEPGGGGAKIYYSVPIYERRNDYIFNITNNIKELEQLKFIENFKIKNYTEIESWLYERQELVINIDYKISKEIIEFLEGKENTADKNYEDFVELGLIAGKSESNYKLYRFKNNQPIEIKNIENIDKLIYYEKYNVFKIFQNNQKGLAYSTEKSFSKRIIITTLTENNIEISNYWIIINDSNYYYKYFKIHEDVNILKIEELSFFETEPNQISDDLFILSESGKFGVFSIELSDFIIKPTYQKLKERGKIRNQNNNYYEIISYFLTERNIVFIRKNNYYDFKYKNTALYQLTVTDNLPIVLENKKIYQIKINGKWGVIYPNPTSPPYCFSDEKILCKENFFTVNIKGKNIDISKDIIGLIPYNLIKKDHNFQKIEAFNINSSLNLYKVKDNDQKIIILDQHLSILIAATYAEEILHRNGKFIIRFENSYKLIESDGSINKKLSFDSVPILYNGKFISGIISMVYKLYNINGDLISESGFEEIPILLNDSYFICKINRYGIINISGEKILDYTCDNILSGYSSSLIDHNRSSPTTFSNEYLILLENGLYQVFNLKRKFIYRFNSESPPVFYKGIYIVKSRGFFGVLSKENKIYIDFNYTEITSLVSPNWFTLLKCCKNSSIDIYHIQSKKMLFENCQSIYFKKVDVNRISWSLRPYIKTFIIVEKNNDKFFISPNYPYASTNFNSFEELFGLYWKDRSIAF
ncbi:hypothetical protein [Cyclobacterium salsum]|uniref:hypothetical protein n=1 Tax=Cyclobacterium salsum TaxID=2666329 RepID=UPI001390F37B|nr:hypothetical protein [Cyclobacterium salsum]